MEPFEVFEFVSCRGKISPQSGFRSTSVVADILDWVRRCLLRPFYNQYLFFSNQSLQLDVCLFMEDGGWLDFFFAIP